MEGKSAEIALAEAVTKMEKGIKSGFALTVLHDIEGAFNHKGQSREGRGCIFHQEVQDKACVRTETVW